MMKGPLSKVELRRRFLAKRQALSDAQRQELNRRITEHLTNWLKARQVFLFYPVRGEPDLRGLFQQLPGLAFGLPVVDASNHLVFRHWRQGAALVPNKFGILEPDAAAPILYPDAQTVILTPCLALDMTGVRLGYGGGFYDRLLIKTPATAVAVLFHEFLVKELPHEPHDVRLNTYVTERGMETLA